MDQLTGPAANPGPRSRVSCPEVDMQHAISGIPAAFTRADSHLSTFVFLHENRHH